MVYHPDYNIDLGPHIFPARKYQMIYDLVKQDHKLANLYVYRPEPAKDKDLALVHTEEFLNDFFSLKITERTQSSELPLTKQIVQSFVLAVGGTILATELTEKYKFVYHIGGGFHHSMPDRAEGFCYLNDAAIAVKLYQRAYPGRKILFIDLDLHQGNGNSVVFQEDPDVFTFSMHQENLYPKKEKSGLDIPLEEGTNDGKYLELLVESLRKIESDFKPDLIFYIAGADPFEGDSLGDLKLTFQGLRKRDKIVRDFVSALDVSAVILPAGGYAKDFYDTVTIHYNTIKVFAAD
ncbi:histone deacetylase family protein [Leptospira santarosai str. HAI821]|nr:histone deacetylase family protein [Leptospira santarosai str. CBC523]EMO31868.1 histone deacetylase family protein [Leptospira santarosai str. HAI821]EMO71032.1 histone deacetylase family protein [Leptospira santarosai str. 200403458]EMO83569.1 histone deacetylase family protein [Leptospira santarosai str. AIM]EMP00005.1 histone deacetylase family protein [Leptospira santarosai str. 200702252]EMP82233.1 histone deacetylase family protein [Leptospira santarosai str. CBC1531]EPG84400.1 hist